MTNEINFSKPVQTVTGCRVEFFYHDGDELFPHIGVIHCHNGRRSANQWDSKGGARYGGVACHIVNVPEETVRWVNVYKRNTGHDLHTTRESALHPACQDRTGLLKLTFINDKLVKADVEDV